MTDSVLVKGILQNDERVWRWLYRQHKDHFVATARAAVFASALSQEDWDDIFHESCVKLMEKVNGEQFSVGRDGGLFSFLVEIGKGLARNLMRKRRPLDEKQQNAIADNVHPEERDFDMTTHDKQQAQDDFLDRVFSSIPEDCQMILKEFYWGGKPMNEIASMMGLRNADTAKTKKNKCMNKFKEIAAMLLESDEFAEDAVRASVERAALRELLEEERRLAANPRMRQAALDLDDDMPEDE